MCGEKYFNYCCLSLAVTVDCILCLSADQPEGLSGTLLGGGRQDAPGLPQTLQQEFSLVNLQIRNVNVEVSSVFA